jgi:hypothetical protein
MEMQRRCGWRAVEFAPLTSLSEALGNLNKPFLKLEVYRLRLQEIAEVMW